MEGGIKAGLKSSCSINQSYLKISDSHKAGLKSSCSINQSYLKISDSNKEDITPRSTYCRDSLQSSSFIYSVTALRTLENFIAQNFLVNLFFISDKVSRHTKSTIF